MSRLLSPARPPGRAALQVASTCWDASSGSALVPLASCRLYRGHPAPNRGRDPLGTAAGTAALLLPEECPPKYSHTWIPHIPRAIPYILSSCRRIPFTPHYTLRYLQTAALRQSWTLQSWEIVVDSIRCW